MRAFVYTNGKVLNTHIQEYHHLKNRTKLCAYFFNDVSNVFGAKLTVDTSIRPSNKIKYAQIIFNIEI